MYDSEFALDLYKKKKTTLDSQFSNSLVPRFFFFYTQHTKAATHYYKGLESNSNY